MKTNTKDINNNYTIYILASFKQFLKTNFDFFYKSKRDTVRRHYSIPLSDKLWFNGFDYKPVFFINEDGCLENIEIPIQRMVWIKGSGERAHIYLYPSFIIKYCPFPTSTLEYIWENCIIPSVEPFDIIKDSNNLLDSSIPLEYHTNKTFNFLGTLKYLTKWNYLYNKTLHSLPQIVEEKYLEPNISVSKYTYLLIQMFVKGVRLNLSKYEYLSFANFQIPFK